MNSFRVFGANQMSFCGTSKNLAGVSWSTRFEKTPTFEAGSFGVPQMTIMRGHD